MRRRTFLALAGGLALAGTALPALPRTAGAATIDRKTRWPPVLTDLVQWRYLAGRIVDQPNDYGFVVSVTDIRIPGQQAQELLVERQDFTGAKQFSVGSYTGTLAYSPATYTYSFQHAQASASWQWDDAAGVYRLSLSSPELTLQNVVLRPQGGLIAEGGDGDIRVGETRGIAVGSDYHADWTAIEIGGQAKGFARLDMQGLYPLSLQSVPTQASSDYDHHWFAIAGVLEGQPVWVSFWRIETASGPYWDVTIARGSGQSWTVPPSTTEASSVAFPLTIQPLVLQPLPNTVSAELKGLRAGQRWRVTAGQSTSGDLLDLTIEVPPRQFVQSARFGAAGGLSWMEEALGNAQAVTGTVLGKPISDVRLAVAETTAEYDLVLVPLAQR